MAELRLDTHLIDALGAGTLDAQGQAKLAEQVATILPYHWELPNPHVGDLTRLTDLLGGQEELLLWLDRFPGRPRRVAWLYQLIELLDRISMEPAVVTALEELRSRTPYPPGTESHLLPDTDSETLPSAVFRIEELLGDGRDKDAVAFGVALTHMLEQMAPRVRELDPKLSDLADAAKRLRQEILSAD